MNKQDEQWITSVGIDLGTSTTKMIVSRLRLSRSSNSFSLPRYEIADRILMYESKVRTTPLISENEINVSEVMSWLQEEYRMAGIQLSDIKSGAVIITGETANKNNSRQILHSLSDKAGDFVVAAAGADLESLLSGKGSGASQRSKLTRQVICNIDIGGGTANASFFYRGKMIATITFHVGGRLIRMHPNGEITYISEAIVPWLKASGFHLHIGQTPSLAYMKQMMRGMSRCMLDFLSGRSGVGGWLLVTESQGLKINLPDFQEVMISGGVGSMLHCHEPSSFNEIAIYGDIGPLLAYSIREEINLYSIELISPEHTTRATVIGAGMQSTEISGATIYLTKGVLPLKNIPVVRLENGDVRKAIAYGMQIYDETMCPPFALFIPAIHQVTYAYIRQLSDSLLYHYSEMVNHCSTLVVICENDMGKALGQALQLRASGERTIICIDQIKVEFGDFLDLGEPIEDTMIPVIVKTLAFHSG
ncbi:ethanolamine ammonia-lyase reactivating factor EutA [Paenibacillus sp. DS2015]|uniref:ethanolamine ammonia-lyase reactivating factor EutA n=1 Tax=Paenibacillus sp. DS2015 TaxID=3373917 RepID=UPI003D2136AE